MRVAVVLCSLFAVSAAFADTHKDTHKPKDPQPPVDPTPPKPPPPPPGPEDAHARAILDKLAATTDPAARTAAIDELDKLAPKAVDAIGAYLVRKHESSVADRRKLLASVKAAVPDKSGHFNMPERRTAKEEQADDDFDWRVALAKVDGNPVGLGETIADDAAIRALGATRDFHAAAFIFEAAFADDTMIYRDECGRYIRRMEAYSLPALVIESESGNNYDRRRYATYQLERMDRQEPSKAIDAAIGDEALTVAILEAFRLTHHREAVHAVWAKVDAESPSVREAARTTWMAYVSGPPPPPAPRRHLQLAGGKTTAYSKPLWLTYREMADNELRKAANELLKEDYPLADPSMDDNGAKGKSVEVDVEALTKRLFAHFDEARAAREGGQWTAAKAKADAGDLAAATAMLDRLLATNPERAERPDMAKVYLAWAKALEAKQQWADASAAYAKASLLDPKGPSANDALAAHHFTLGKALDAQGKDGGPDFRRAVALRPDYAPAKEAASAADPSSSSPPRPLWMLYIAGTVGGLALLMFGVAMMRRRA